MLCERHCCVYHDETANCLSAAFVASHLHRFAVIVPDLTRLLSLFLPLVKCFVLIGELQNRQHGIAGTVYVDDATTIRIENFHYDGLGPGM